MKDEKHIYFRFNDSLDMGSEGSYLFRTQILTWETKPYNPLGYMNAVLERVCEIVPKRVWNLPILGS